MNLVDSTGAKLAGDDASARMARVVEIAAKAAETVDREGRFPREVFDALKSERLLGIAVPAELGGEGVSTAAIADLIVKLAQACGSSAMIYAMHQIQISSLVSHGIGNEWHRAFMRRIASEQLLLASATSEAGIGGNLRNSICAVEVADGRFSLTKDATVISYGSFADAILATARRAPDAPSTDQVMVVIPADGSRVLERKTVWDTLGMRGTCSDGFLLTATGDAGQIFPKPFSEIAAQSMLASSHIYWAATWFGIAADAFARAQSFVKQAARKQPNMVPPGALRLSEAAAKLQAMKGHLVAAIRRFDAAERDEDDLSSISFAAEINALKVAASEKADEIVRMAMLITGILGYKNGTPFSVGRHLRDVTSAVVMISNDRIHANTSTLLLMSRFDTRLGG
ncbi:acyl-CoA dehydrogenase family protein [Mesorhizobium sp. ES1-1]|uniref:acyl-CoA dehydrogenase family protein n=1 Tax=Mesorhizobium sp. ES1-1 TaxID=2876629 RepID=UPI001CCFAE22|nr:acyl-CoA dehydrogenase family protein [Mesorhizobium sp. ES1-1]MBZ9674372.1 acyl-CoA/acyl-ACP dehydrogenase [Mesorhizobium sp. ES1-1]